MKNANDNEPKSFVEGDRVQMRGQPWLQGTVWSIEPDVSGCEVTIVAWDDEDENAFVTNPRRLQRLPTPESRPTSGVRLRPV
jgi:hypothetical protein